MVGQLNNNLGPISVGVLNYCLFRYPISNDRSMLIITIVFGLLSSLILAGSIRYYNHSAKEILAAELAEGNG